ncbi:MAG: nitrogen fixation protein NifZ [Gallionella sp.]|nr:nitrogen fixation protein NifZ [Gallionella sp.]MDD4959260.1 nitrogen fixation protein NifZ [Gallionella sp.]MDD4963475.1 nitrogen fixation protein NifZ [Gallionella sp.]
MLPKYEFGDEVRIIRNVRNDGTYPGVAIGTLLIRRGSTGFVMNVGTFLQDQLIYTVNILEQNKIVGFREEELISIDEPWIPSKFESREKVRCKVTLAVRGEVRASPGSEGEVLKVLRDESGGVQYQVIFLDRVLQVPESALEATRVYDDEEQKNG